MASGSPAQAHVRTVPALLRLNNVDLHTKQLCLSEELMIEKFQQFLLQRNSPP